MKKILVIDGHPGTQRLCSSLVEHYVKGARDAGAQVEVVHVGSLHFSPSLTQGYRSETELEPDLQNVQQLLTWCEHLVVVYPTWWSGMPGILKGLWDRIMLPGFAFRYRKSLVWDKLLQGRSAHIITTMDAPGWIDRFFLGRLGVRTLRNGILKFCGFSPVTTTVIGSVRKIQEKEVKLWQARVYSLGHQQARK